MAERYDEHFVYQPHNVDPNEKAEFVKKLPIKKQIRYREMREVVLDRDVANYINDPGLTRVKDKITGTKFTPELLDKRANPYGKDVSDLTLQGPVPIEQYYSEGWPMISTDAMNAQKVQQLKAFGLRVVSAIGRGSYGQVLKMVDIVSNRELAAKVMPIKMFYKSMDVSMRGAVKWVLKEVTVLRGLTHQNLVNIEGVVHVRDDVSGFRSLFVIVLMELCAGDLNRQIQRHTGAHMNEQSAREWFAQISDALRYLHSKRVTHMDVKPENILYVEYPSTQPNTAPVRVYKLADFGLAQVVEGSGPLKKKGQSKTGTYLFIAPELRTGSNRTLDLGKCDVYSLAITLGRSLIGLAQPKHIKKFAIFGQTPGLQARQWIQAELIDKNRFAFNDLIIQLLLIMIEKDPALRPNMAQVCEHWWVTSNAHP